MSNERDQRNAVPLLHSVRSAVLIAMVLALGLVVSEALHLTVRSPYFLADIGTGLLRALAITAATVIVVAILIAPLVREMRLQGYALSAAVYLAVSFKVVALDAALLSQVAVVAAFGLLTLGVFAAVYWIGARLQLSWQFPVIVALGYTNVCLGIASGWALSGGRLMAFLSSSRTIAVIVVSGAATLICTAAQWFIERRKPGSAWRGSVIIGILAALTAATLVLMRRLPVSHTHNTAGSKEPDIYVMSFDALRADVLDQFIAEHPASQFARFAATATSYRNVVAPGPSTDATLARNTFIGAERTNCAATVPHALALRGYYTAMLFGAAAKRFQGSVCYEYYFSGDGDKLVNRFIVPALGNRLLSKMPLRGKALEGTWLLTRLEALTASPQPLFAYLHFLELHAPYVPATKRDSPQFLETIERFMDQCYAVSCDPQNPENAELIAKARAAYVELVTELDGYLGRALELARDRGRDFIMIVTADHGELFGEHGGFAHSGGLVPELLHVPFIVFDSRHPSPARRCDLALANEELTNVVGATSNDLSQRDNLEFSAPPLGSAQIAKQTQQLTYQLFPEVLRHAGTWRNIHHSPSGTLPYPIETCN